MLSLHILPWRQRDKIVCTPSEITLHTITFLPSSCPFIKTAFSHADSPIALLLFIQIQAHNHTYTLLKTVKGTIFATGRTSTDHLKKIL